MNQKTKFSHPCFEYIHEEGNHHDVILCDEGRNEYYIIVDGSMQVCPTCGGFGKHERTDIDCSKIVDSYIEDGDYDGLQRYYAGSFDVTCSHCNGKNVVFEPNTDSLPKWASDEIIRWSEMERENAEYAAKERAAFGY